MVLDSNQISKIHNFVVISHIYTYTLEGYHISNTMFTDLQFNVITHFKMSDEIFFNTRKTPIMRAFFGNQKIRKIMTPKLFYTQSRFSKFITVIEERREGKHTHPHFTNPSTAL